jgi:SP family general alpha glucoside:H+ symporter-like MFS transporter
MCQISSLAMLVFGLCATLGPLFGVAIATPFVSRFGYRLTALIFLVAGCAATLIPFFANNIKIMTAGFLLQCIPWGVYQVVSPAFISEVASLKLRPVLTTYNNLCWILGQCTASLVALAFATELTMLGFRIPIAINWAFAMLLLVGMFFAPDSPSYYLRKGQRAKAMRAAQKLWADKDRASGKVHYMLSIIHHEELSTAAVAEKARPTSLWGRVRSSFRVDCLSPIARRRTLVTCGIWFFQTFTGHALTSYAFKLFETAGLSAEQGYQINSATPVLGIIGTVCACFVMQRAGRKTMYLSGLAGQGSLLILVGATAFVPNAKVGGWISGSLVAVFNLIYQLTLGPVTYTIVSELPSLRLRTSTLALARATYLLGSTMNQFIASFVLHPEAANLGAKTAFVYAGVCAAAVVFTYNFLPETKGKSAAEVDDLFRSPASGAVVK